MKKILLCASLIALSTSALASDMYVRGDVGASQMNLKRTGSKVESGKIKPAYNVGLGYKINDMFRTDLNVQYKEAKPSKGHAVVKNTEFKTVAVVLNGYYDFKNDSAFTPYVTAGLGFAKNTAKATTSGITNKSSNEFAWNAGLGSKFNVTSNVDLDVSYKYSHLGKFKMKQSTTKHDVKSHAHELLAGVIYSF